MSTDLVASLLAPHGFAALSMHRVPDHLRARPQFRGADEWLCRWRRAPVVSEAQDDLDFYGF